ncbi:MAG TPA: SPFH domain-containing protein [Acidimicrobiales bacterium]|jgi:regulator of protease activity HflC (stomatin/prohibitin superfamily)|nr:SPFH domain-containing protein [Acidimicrobiales bacterium]
MALVILLGAIAFVFFAIVVSAVKIIRPYERGLVERLGKYHATVEPGLRLIYPFIDKMVRVDMRERVVDVPPQEVITSDNVVVSVDAVVYYEATDPQRLVYNVVDFYLAVTKLAQTNLRNVIGDMQLDEALTSRDTINTRLREILDDATDKWGTRVVRVEIQRIDPPADVMSAMHEQMKAERTRRATVTTAQGDREAAITRAEGEKQSAILAAEGEKQSAILYAEGEREAQIARASGEAEAIRQVYSAIHEGNPSADLLAIKYLETLAAVANGQATKIFLPTEATAMLGALGGMKELFEAAGDAAPNGAPSKAVTKR